MNRLLTVPEEVPAGEEVWVTGNEYIALPAIRSRDGAVASLNVLSWAARGLLELEGPGAGLLHLDPVLPVQRVEWLSGWIPRLCCPLPDGRELEITYLVPPGRKGLIVYARVSVGTLPVSLVGELAGVNYRVYCGRPLSWPVCQYWNRWMHCLVWEFGQPLPQLAVAIGASGGDLDSLPADSARPASRTGGQDVPAARFRLASQGSEMTVALGVAPEGDGACCQVVDILRHGYHALLSEAQACLDSLGNAGLGEMWRRQLFFNFFFARGRCLDNEQLVLVTSRSPRYYVSAAHWNRDALLWSFPGLLLADVSVAREALRQAFHLYARRAGIHSLYLDGTELYPGFELDELAAFPVALGLYLDETGDDSVVELPEVRDGLSTVWEAIQRARVRPHGLYHTFLLPSDDPAHHPFVSYDLALLWRGLRVMGRLGWSQAVAEAEQLRAELYRRAVVPGPFGAMWAWSFDEEGHYLLYDEPPGSLALLAYYGFCAPDDPVYLHTLRWIWSSENPHFPREGRFAVPACPHAPHPWVMSLANALLVPPESWRVLGRDPEEFRRQLEAAPMDGGLACETIGLHDGRVRTGAAFATCAGFLAWALALYARRVAGTSAGDAAGCGATPSGLSTSLVRKGAAGRGSVW